MLNTATVLAGSGLGVALRGRLPDHTRALLTDTLGLVTLLIAALNCAAVADPALRRAIGPSAPVLVVLGSLVAGGVAGSLLRLEDGVTRLGETLQRRLSRGRDSRFVEGYVTASLVFCVGPLTVLGSLSDGLGRGIEQLALKSVLDGVASIAFASALGWGVAASAVTVAVVQGCLTVVGVALGSVLSDAAVAGFTATGGVLLVGVGLRLLDLRRVAVADLLPALVLAPAAVAIVAALR